MEQVLEIPEGDDNPIENPGVEPMVDEPDESEPLEITGMGPRREHLVEQVTQVGTSSTANDTEAITNNTC